MRLSLPGSFVSEKTNVESPCRRQECGRYGYKMQRRPVQPLPSAPASALRCLTASRYESEFTWLSVTDYLRDFNWDRSGYCPTNFRSNCFPARLRHRSPTLRSFRSKKRHFGASQAATCLCLDQKPARIAV